MRTPTRQKSVEDKSGLVECNGEAWEILGRRTAESDGCALQMAHGDLKRDREINLL